MYKKRTFSTIFIWAIRSFYNTDKDVFYLFLWMIHLFIRFRELNQTYIIFFLCPVHPVLPLWVFAAPVPEAVFNGKLKKRGRNVFFTNPSSNIKKKCADVNSVNQTHPDTFTHIKHDVSLRFSFVIHPTSSNKHHCQEYHRHSIIVRAVHCHVLNLLHFYWMYRKFI